MNKINFFLLLVIFYSQNKIQQCSSSSSTNSGDGGGVSGRPPRLKPFQFDSNLIDGKFVLVTCQLEEDVGSPVSFKWFKDGRPLLPSSSSSSSSHLTIETRKDYSTLTINRINRIRDSGNYTCQADNNGSGGGYGHARDQVSSQLIIRG